MTTSWVIVNRETGEAVMETFRQKTANAVNRTKYDVIPILEYLVNLNARIKEKIMKSEVLILYQVSDNQGNRRFIISKQWDESVSFFLDQEGKGFSIETSVNLAAHLGGPVELLIELEDQ